MFGRNKKADVYRGVTAYVGLPGSGKSYGLVQRAYREFQKDNPRPVFVNAGFNVRGAYSFRSFDEFLEIPDGAIVLWDELPLYVSSRRWQDFPDGLLYRLTQIRKDGLELHYSTIDWGMVDKNVRNITFWVWECEQRSARMLKRRKFPPEHRRRKDERPRRTEYVRLNEDVLALYDSYSKVATTSKGRGTSNQKTAELWGGVAVDGLTVNDWVDVAERPSPPDQSLWDEFVAAGGLERKADALEDESAGSGVLENVSAPPPPRPIDVSALQSASSAFKS